MELSRTIADRPPAPRICQRCRVAFPGDVAATPGVVQEWWACDRCRSILLGSRAAHRFEET